MKSKPHHKIRPFKSLIVLTIFAAYSHSYGQVRQQAGQAISGRASELIADGANHSLIIDQGEVYAAGVNSSGQLGNGSYSNVPTLTRTKVLNLTNVIAVKASVCSLALKSDGTVWAWGDNSQGELGINSAIPSSNLPVQVKSPDGNGFLTDVIAIAATGFTSYALKADGTVWSWGWNVDGLLGIGDSTVQNSLVPVQVQGLSGIGYLTNVTALAASPLSSFVLALKSDGRVVSWGNNDYGQLGNTQVGFFNTNPVQVVLLSKVIAIAAGGCYSLALKSDGTVWSWGYNHRHELGNASSLPLRPFPGPVTGPDGSGILSNIIAIAGGFLNGQALAADGTVLTWGGNDNGELGIGTIGGDQTIPTRVRNANGVGFLNRIVAIYPSAMRAYGLRSDGKVFGWGSSYGFGNGLPSGNYPLPVPVSEFTNGQLAVATGESHSLALRIDGAVKSWGYDLSGQLGDGDSGPNADKNTPVDVKGVGGVGALQDIKAIAGAGSHSVALGSNGQIYTWGSNFYGQLGNGTNIDSTVPGVTGPYGQPILADAVAIASSPSGAHTLALKSDGTVWAWGLNTNGQLGTQNNINSNRPAKVIGLDDVIAVAAGESHSLALKSNGTVWAWGKNYDGQLGNSSGGLGSDQSTPVQVVALSDVIAVAAGGAHSIALRADGTVWAWGVNREGQLGNGTYLSSNVPVQVTMGYNLKFPIKLANVKAIGGGGASAVGNSVALKADGTVWTWGANNTHQLATPVSVPNSSFPVKAEGITGTKAISSIASHGILLKSDGKAFTVGDNLHGQLGRGPGKGSSVYLPVP